MRRAAARWHQCRLAWHRPLPDSGRPKTGHSMMQMVVQCMPQQRRKHCERRQIGMGIGRNTRSGAGRSVEHPGRNR